MVYGDRRPYPVALITVNLKELAKFAKEQGILVTDSAFLTQHAKVIERVGCIVEEKLRAAPDLREDQEVRAVLRADFSQEGAI
jgi:long-chain acyl-CoA synthetase